MYIVLFISFLISTAYSINNSTAYSAYILPYMVQYIQPYSSIYNTTV